MKKVLALAALTITLSISCTNQSEEELNILPETNQASHNSFKLDKSEAIEIAYDFFNNHSGANGSRSYGISIDYIVNNKTTASRSRSIPDTLSYVVNRGENDGFILIATDKRKFPILAYSNEGTFNMTDIKSENIVYDNFVSLLPAYYESIKEDDTDVELSSDYWDSCLTKLLEGSTGWNQEAPFNKYIQNGYPAGCVAVATGLIMHYCKDNLTYHNEQFDFKNIRYAMEGNSLATITRDEAIDRIAKLLYYLGIDLNMRYSATGSGTSSNLTLNFLRNNKYNVVHTSFNKFSYTDIAWDIAHKRLIYVGNVGHAWVLDGCQFCFVNPTIANQNNYTKEDITNVFVHCDWGWGGQYNGFYNGEVFSPYTYNYSTSNMEYYSVEYSNVSTPPIDFLH